MFQNSKFKNQETTNLQLHMVEYLIIVETVLTCVNLE